MTKNLEKAVPAAYTSPYVEVVEMELGEAVLQVSGENEGYDEETWS